MRAELLHGWLPKVPHVRRKRASVDGRDHSHVAPGGTLLAARASARCLLMVLCSTAQFVGRAITTRTT